MKKSASPETRKRMPSPPVSATVANTVVLDDDSSTLLKNTWVVGTEEKRSRHEDLKDHPTVAKANIRANSMTVTILTLLEGTTPAPKLLGSSVPLVVLDASTVVKLVVVVVDVVVSISTEVNVTPFVYSLPDVSWTMRSKG